jgi:hypothetical protein
MRTRISSNAGLTMLETILIIVMLSIVCIVVLPTRIEGGPSSSKEHRCFMNREAIDNAKILWASEQKKAGTNTPNEDDLKVYLKDNKFPVCPSGGTCTIGAVNVRTRCSARWRRFGDQCSVQRPAQSLIARVDL